jgi:hypothetical protein
MIAAKMSTTARYITLSLIVMVTAPGFLTFCRAVPRAPAGSGHASRWRPAHSVRSAWMRPSDHPMPSRTIPKS